MNLYRILGPLVAVAVVSSVSLEAHASWCFFGHGPGCKSSSSGFSKKGSSFKSKKGSSFKSKKGSSSGSGAQKAPELDATGAPVGLALALGGILVVAGRRRRSVSGV